MENPRNNSADGDADIVDLVAASDGQLVVGIARGREDALAEAYSRHGGACFGLARRLVGDNALAEEVVQEVILRLWKAPERYDAARGSLRSYLLAQTHGRAIDLVRAESARRRREEKEARLAPEEPSDLEREVVQLSLAEHVRTALDGLTEGERKAIELAYFGGHTYREVAVLLNEPEGTVKSRIRSGLARLRAALNEMGIGEPWAN